MIHVKITKISKISILASGETHLINMSILDTPQNFPTMLQKDACSFMLDSLKLMCHVILLISMADAG